MTRKKNGRLPVLKIDAERHEVHVGRKLVRLAPKELRILEVLQKADGRVLSQDKIMSLVWGYSDHEIRIYSESRRVDTYIFTLRRKLERVRRGASKLISTVPTRGYKMIRRRDKIA